MLAPILFMFYMKLLASLISNFGFGYHFYADVQFYVTFNHTNAFDARVITNSLKAVQQWLTLNKLKLNPSKTQCMVFSRKKPVSNVLDDGKSLVISHNSIKNLGIILDWNLPPEELIRFTVKKCFFHICSIGKISNYINEENCKVPIKNLVFHLDYCSSMYYGLLNILLSRLQRV